MAGAPARLTRPGGGGLVQVGGGSSQAALQQLIPAGEGWAVWEGGGGGWGGRGEGGGVGVVMIPGFTHHNHSSSEDI
jgi:hypothetical protein